MDILFWHKHSNKKHLIDQKLDLCHNCLHYQFNCPYDSKGNQIIGCDFFDYITQVHKQALLNRQVHCPKCNSIDITKTYGERFYCNKCGRIFS